MNFQELLQKHAQLMDTAKEIYGRAFKNYTLIQGRDKEAREFADLLLKINEARAQINLFTDNGAKAGEYLGMIDSPEEFITAHRKLDENAALWSRHDLKAGFNPGASPQDFPETKFIAAHESKTYRNLFCGKNERAHLDNGGFRSFGEFAEAIFSGRADERLTSLIRAAVRENVPSDGGFAVPAEYAGLIQDKSLEKQIVRPRATVIPMDSQTKKITAIDGYSHTSHLFGGITTSYTNEGGTISDSSPKFREMQLTAHKMTALIKPSNEVLEDAPNCGTNLINMLADAFAFNEDYYYIHGTGTGQPLGILNDPALITVDAEGGQAADTILYANLCNIFSRMHPACLPYAEWFINPELIPQLLQLSITYTNNDVHVPVLTKNGKTGQFEILTRPVTFSEKMSAKGDVGDILFADMSQYFIGLRRNVIIATSPHVYFESDQMAIRGILRHDGQGSWKSAVTPKKGSATLSWAVTLAAR
ncbi:MAG: phage major capsid protein [Bacillota bacterium]